MKRGIGGAHLDVNLVLLVRVHVGGLAVATGEKKCVCGKAGIFIWCCCCRRAQLGLGNKFTGRMGFTGVSQVWVRRAFESAWAPTGGWRRVGAGDKIIQRDRTATGWYGVSMLGPPLRTWPSVMRCVSLRRLD